MDNKPRVIINADDFGLNESCSKAITEAFNRGMVTDTTMMATGEYFDEAVELAKSNAFFGRIGIHLNLTEGVPLTEPILNEPRFVTNGRFNKQYDRNKKLTKSESEAIYTELTAQVEKIKQAKINITHADSHHHIHTGIFIAPIVSRICDEQGIKKIRLHRNLGSIPAVKLFLKNRFNKKLRKQGFCTTDYFAYPIDLGTEIPDNTEIMVHPDFDKGGVLIDRKGKDENGIPKGKPLTNFNSEYDITLRGYKQL